jgi:hypothetical protein
MPRVRLPGWDTPPPPPPPPADPTEVQYQALRHAYDFFNTRLFSGSLPRCLITLRANGRTFGYFANDRFGERVGTEGKVVDEIALNPKPWRSRSIEDSLSTLVHEMIHVRQYHFGTRSRPGYHNREWAAMMKEIGLHPSSTGAAGGRETGQQMSHYIIEDGKFARACRALLETGWHLRFADVMRDKERGGTTRMKFTCPSCGANAWGRPDLCIACISVHCGTSPMLPEVTRALPGEPAVT